MARALKALLVVVAAIIVAAPSAAATERVHVRLRGGFAEALWSRRTETTFSEAFVEVSSRYGELAVFEFTDTFDENGDFVSETSTQADVFGGFTFTIDERKLSTAHLTATDVPAVTCVNFGESCTDTTIDLDVTWTGQGAIGRSGYNSHFVGDHFVSTEHFVGTSRNATAQGTIDSVTWTVSDLEFADLGQAKSGYTDICIGC